MSDLEKAISEIPPDLFYTIGKGMTRMDEPAFGAAIYRGVVGDPGDPLAEGESDVSLADAVRKAVAALSEKRSEGES